MVRVKVVKIFIDKENGEEQRKYGEIFETTEERASYLHSHGAVVYLEEAEQIEEVEEQEEKQKEDTGTDEEDQGEDIEDREEE